MADNNGNGRSAEAERYRQAATDALEMLDWCIGYLVGSRKHEPEEPLPTGKG